MPKSEVSVNDLDDIVGTAAAEINSWGDSDDDVDTSAEEQPDDSEDPDDEDADEVDDIEDSEDEESEDDDPDDDLDTDDDDEESDDDEDDDDEELEDDEDEDSEESESVELSDDVTVRLSDGTEITGRELREGYLRQQDYTKKTQHVSDVYKKMEKWYEERSSNPKGWVAEIAYSQDDPAEVIAGAIRETGNATVLLGQTLRHLVESGEIADELVDALNLTAVAEQAKETSLHDEVKSLKQQLQERDKSTEEQQRLAQVEQQLNSQWQNVVTSEGLEFSDPAEEQTAKVKLLEFARDNGIPNLEVAYAARAYQAGSPKRQPKKASSVKKKASSAVKKRKTAAMSRKPTGGSSTSRPSNKGGSFVEDAASAALEELGLEV